jgi:Holliday junction resolvase-like predicted endonuclease
MGKQIKPSCERVQFGRQNEEKAKNYFEAIGYQWLVSNYKWKHGEGDLFFLDPLGSLVLVEVRSARKTSVWLRHSVDQRKVWNLTRTLEHFCCRFNHKGSRRIEILFIEGERFDHLPVPF